jgi:hypothetical protein
MKGLAGHLNNVVYNSHESSTATNPAVTVVSSDNHAESSNLSSASVSSSARDKNEILFRDAAQHRHQQHQRVPSLGARDSLMTAARDQRVSTEDTHDNSDDDLLVCEATTSLKDRDNVNESTANTVSRAYNTRTSHRPSVTLKICQYDII